MPAFANAIVNGGQDYREQALRSFEDRLGMLRALVTHLAAHSPVPLDALLLPAGYFCAASASQADGLGVQVTTSLSSRQPPFTVVWGIDGWTPLSEAKLERGSTGYPFFVHALPRNQGQPRCFQQFAIAASEGASANDIWGDRSPTCCQDIGLLICGESWSDALLARIEAARPKVLLLPAHRKVNLMTDAKQGWARLSWHLRLDCFSRRTGIPVILSEHTRSPNRHAHAWGAKAVRTQDLPEDLGSLFTVKLVEV